MGSTSCLSRTTLSKANEPRDWRIYVDFAQSLIRTARPLYANEDLEIDLVNTVYTLYAFTIDFCLSLFPWTLSRTIKSSLKLNTLLYLRGNIPAFIHISDGRLHDVNVLDTLFYWNLEPFTSCIEAIWTLHVSLHKTQKGAFFVKRLKSNKKYLRRYSHPTDMSKGIQCDQTFTLTGVHSASCYPNLLRRVKFHYVQFGKTINFLINNFSISAPTVADLYRYCWQVELFFKWIKEHLRRKSCYGTLENAVQSQIWIAVSV